MSFKDKILKNQSPWGSPPGGGSSQAEMALELEENLKFRYNQEIFKKR